MTQRDPKRSRRPLVWMIALAAGIGAAVWLAVGLLESDGSTPNRSDAETTAASLHAPVATPPGPERLRDDATQVLDPGSGLAAARAALARVEAELAGTTDPRDLTRLQRKRELIRQAIDRLTTTGGR